MAAELLLAIGLPLGLLLVTMLAMERWPGRLPPWLQRLSERPALAWNVTIGLMIGLSLLRWLLKR